jgi:hypothetical protein
MSRHTRTPRRTDHRNESCRFCGGQLLASVFDTVFRSEAASRGSIAVDETAAGSTPDERLFFAIPGALCVPCRQLYVDQQLIGILGLGDARCTFAIESDRVLRAGAV